MGYPDTQTQKLAWHVEKSTMNEDAFPIEHVDFPQPVMLVLGTSSKKIGSFYWER